MFEEEFYDYTVKSSEGKRLGYDVDNDIKRLARFVGFDIMDLLYQMREQGKEEMTVTLTLRRYPEDEGVECSETEKDY